MKRERYKIKVSPSAYKLKVSSSRFGTLDTRDKWADQNKISYSNANTLRLYPE